MKYVIEVKNLTKSFNKFKAVDDITFKVKKGGIFAFLGLNGAGKSTTINMLTQIMNKDHGKVFINGYDLDDNPAIVKHDIGIVFQNSVLDNELTVIQNLNSRASLYNLTRQEGIDRINYLVELFELNDILSRPYGVLSGGQKRRVDIARALIHRPKILFLDEPTTGLDPVTRVKVWDILNNLILKEDLTIFLTTHYMEEVNDANYVIIIDEGKIVAEGTPHSLKTKYATDKLKVYNANKKLEILLKTNKISYTYTNKTYLIDLESSIDATRIINLDSELFQDYEVIKGDMGLVFLNATGKELWVD
ncbi:MAG TPA: ATP-binding cassette domain-containing protein [Candidatus Paceibacterota bacterium]|nr:ATP-binding cassette domain-containing protein [Candidatus Paceibacterota bacterium]